MLLPTGLSSYCSTIGHTLQSIRYIKPKIVQYKIFSVITGVYVFIVCVRFKDYPYRKVSAQETDLGGL